MPGCESWWSALKTVRRKHSGTHGRGLPVDMSQMRGVGEEGRRMVRKSREVSLSLS